MFIICRIFRGVNSSAFFSFISSSRQMYAGRWYRSIYSAGGRPFGLYRATTRLPLHCVRPFSVCRPVNEDQSANKGADIPKEILREIQSTWPVPMREEFLNGTKVTTGELEAMQIVPDKHFVPKSFSDKFAYRLVRTLRLLPDMYFRGDHYMRVVMLETIAAGKGYAHKSYCSPSLKRIYSSWYGWWHVATHDLFAPHEARQWLDYPFTP